MINPLAFSSFSNLLLLNTNLSVGVVKSFKKLGDNLTDIIAIIINITKATLFLFNLLLSPFFLLIYF